METAWYPAQDEWVNEMHPLHTAVKRNKIFSYVLAQRSLTRGRTMPITEWSVRHIVSWLHGQESRHKATCCAVGVGSASLLALWRQPWDGSLPRAAEETGESHRLWSSVERWECFSSSSAVMSLCSVLLPCILKCLHWLISCHVIFASVIIIIIFLRNGIVSQQCNYTFHAVPISSLPSQILPPGASKLSGSFMTEISQQTKEDKLECPPPSTLSFRLTLKLTAHSREHRELKKAEDIIAHNWLVSRNWEFWPQMLISFLLSQFLSCPCILRMLFCVFFCIGIL